MIQLACDRPSKVKVGRVLRAKDAFGWTRSPIFENQEGTSDPRYAPVRGEMRGTVLRPPIRTITDEALWRSAGAAAIDYWSTLADDDQLSSGFRALSREQARRCREVLGA